jgi:hypothetical protein
MLSFIPKPLKVEGRPELEIFPLNVLFAAIASTDGRGVFGSALYEPALSSFRQTDTECSLLYRNSVGGDGLLKITYDAERGIYHGDKFVGGVSVGLSFGTDWGEFFSHLTMVGLTKGEAYIFEPLATKQPETEA